MNIIHITTQQKHFQLLTRGVDLYSKPYNTSTPNLHFFKFYLFDLLNPCYCNSNNCQPTIIRLSDYDDKEAKFSNYTQQ